MNTNILISVADVILSLIFTVVVWRQYFERKRMHQLMWGIAIALWTIGVAAELLTTIQGNWSEMTYRTYYVTGALLIPAWLGMGTLFLVLPQVWANRTLVGLSILSAIGIVLVLAGPAEMSRLQGVSVADVPKGIYPLIPTQLILIILNTLGAAAFILGALWSAYHFMRMKAMGERALATAEIAVGGLVVAVAHSLGALGEIQLFRVSELAAILLIFAGFILSNSPGASPVQSTSEPAPGMAK
ncbi:MAG: hypothetical protein WCF84_20415 [Anaerolineae bacterium]